MIVYPGDLVRRGNFLNFAYRWSDCDYSWQATTLEEGLERTAMHTPLLWDDPKITSAEWPIKVPALVVYSLDDPEADCCLIFAPGTGLVWVPTECLERIGTSCEAAPSQLAGKRYRTDGPFG